MDCKSYFQGDFFVSSPVMAMGRTSPRSGGLQAGLINSHFSDVIDNWCEPGLTNSHYLM